MKKLIVLIMALCVVGCSSDSSDPNGTGPIEITVTDSGAISASRIRGEIATVGEVDRYVVNLAETNRTVQIRCTSDTMRPDVDLLVNVFEQNAQGELVMVAGDHALEDGPGDVDLKVNVFVDTPKRLYINVRDLMDDDVSNNKPYYVSASYEAAPDGNGSFANADALVVGGDAIRDVIGSQDDADCFLIQAADDGVYDIDVDFNRAAGSGVTLQIQVFDDQGSLIEARNQGAATRSHLIHFLAAGDYYVVVNDDGKDDFDNLSYYDISVEEVDGAEAMANDTYADAVAPAGVQFDGSIDYFEDLDIYAVDTAVAGTIKVMDLGFFSHIPLRYLVELHETQGGVTTTAFSHQYRGGDNGDGQYQATLKLDSAAEYHLVVRPLDGASVAVRCPYTVDMTVVGVTDADEAGDGNNVESDAIDLTGVPAHTGKIAYRGDADWFTVTFPRDPSVHRVLSLDLDIPVSEKVQYAMRITCPSEPLFEKIVFNSAADQRDVDLATGILVSPGAGDVSYAVKVHDFQNDNGDSDGEYTLSWSVASVPTAVAACPKGGDTLYHNENDESGLTESVTIEYPDTREAVFKVNTVPFAIVDETHPTRTGAGTFADPVTLHFPWVAGYIDYQGDEDWFNLDLTEPLNPADEAWYYTISVELYANGSEVEYMWEFMPDSNGDDRVSTQWCQATPLTCHEGVLAGYSDASTTADLVDNALTATGYNTGSLWIGKGEVSGSVWDRNVFFRISDFNYLRTAADVLNPDPDNDWGFDAPYYFRLTVRYYSGALQPPAP
ncbi:hypothetical protein JCM14469_32300 [Desulfatiferula olefinivorans]